MARCGGARGPSACVPGQTFLYLAARFRTLSGAANGPFVYRLGRQIFNLKRRVRLP
jgi:hypothetical protein